MIQLYHYAKNISTGGEKWMDVYLRSLVGSGDLHDTVGIDLESDFDLRNTTRRRRDTSELEFAEQVIVLGQ